MRIIIFASPGIVGPFILASLIHLKEEVVRLVLPASQYAVSTEELVAIAANAHVPISKPESLSDPDFYAQVCEDAPDLIIVATFDRKIPQKIIDKAKWAAINIHPSLLPKYRGACPEFWAVRNGESETGVTIHYLSDDFDAGDIILQESIPINNDDTIGMLLYRFASTAARMIVRLLDRFRSGDTLLSMAQDNDSATDAPLVKADDLRIEWTDPVSTIYNLVRAANPLGGAWTTFRGFQLKVWYAEPANAVKITEAPVVPGSIVLMPEKEKVYIRAHEGYLELKAVQQALYYILDGWSFARKAFIKEGESFV